MSAFTQEARGISRDTLVKDEANAGPASHAAAVSLAVSSRLAAANDNAC
jgi:hypothetical protein